MDRIHDTSDIGPMDWAKALIVIDVLTKKDPVEADNLLRDAVGYASHLAGISGDEGAARYFAYEGAFAADQFQKDIAAYILKVHDDAHIHQDLINRKN